MDMSLPEPRPPAPARQWMIVAVSTLVLAGGLALALVFGRVPGLDRIVDGPDFFRRCLVVHVDLALVAWLPAFAATLWCLMAGGRAADRRATLGAVVAAIGLVLLVTSALLPGGQPVLSNYVPAIDHPLFAVALGTFFVGVLLAFGDGRAFAGGTGALDMPEASRSFLRAGALAFVVALLTFIGAAMALPAGLEPLAKWELLAWGGGHVLQFASVAAMLACWLLLLRDALQMDALSPRAGAILAALLVMPLLAAPLLSASGPASSSRRAAFTHLMEAGILPVTLVVMFACVHAIRRARREGRLPEAGLLDGRLLALGASAALTLLGFGLGLSIRGSNTLIPAHYHASIGAVTAAFMGTTPLVLRALARELRGRAARVMRWQPLLFGFGQATFAAGFAMAGAQGMARKVYGAEQVRNLAQSSGLLVMGLGGLVAVIAGLVYLASVSRSLATEIGPDPIFATSGIACFRVAPTRTAKEIGPDPISGMETPSWINPHAPSIRSRS